MAREGVPRAASRRAPGYASAHRPEELRVNRRDFLPSSAGLATGLGLGAGTLAAQAPAGTPPQGQRRQEPAPPVSSLTFKTKPHKALIAAPTEDDLVRMKAAGFDG